MNKIIIGGLVVAIVLAVVALFLGGGSGLSRSDVLSIVEEKFIVIKKELFALGANSGNQSTEPLSCTGGVCIHTEKLPFRDATTTPVTIKNPFGATSTAMVRVDVFGEATSSLQYHVGTTTTAFQASDTILPSSLVRAAAMSTSTLGMIIGGESAVIGTGQVAAGTSVAREIVVGPTQFVTLYVDNPNADDDEGGVEGLTNTFQGNLFVTFKR